MKKSKFTDEQMVQILREADRTDDVAGTAKKHGISDQTIYIWRKRFGTMTPDDTMTRLRHARARLIEICRTLDPATIRGDETWGWVYMVLHGHYVDHLVVIDPWTAQLRLRQVDGDPFVHDPRAADHEGFRAQDAEIEAQFDALIRSIPLERWEGDELTPGWTLRDHVSHTADWFAEATRAIDVWERRGQWLADPEEGVDPWNERHVAASRAAGETPAAALARYDASRVELLDAIDRLPLAELRSPDGWSWAYDCLHGHVRKHLAMLGRHDEIGDQRLEAVVRLDDVVLHHVQDHTTASAGRPSRAPVKVLPVVPVSRTR